MPERYQQYNEIYKNICMKKVKNQIDKEIIYRGNKIIKFKEQLKKTENITLQIMIKKEIIYYKCKLAELIETNYLNKEIIH